MEFGTSVNALVGTKASSTEEILDWGGLLAVVTMEVPTSMEHLEEDVEKISIIFGSI